MSHGITDSDSMFSVREKPWHGLGTILEEYPASVDDALIKSGLDWTVEQGDLLVQTDPDMPLIPAEGFKANMRADNGKVLGIVTDGYTVVQNREAFAWLEGLLGEGLLWETAGSLHEGKRTWVLAKLPEGVEVGGDATQTYVYCANSHDGSMAVTAACSNIRIVCQNTLTWAMNRSDAQRTYKFRHTGSLAAKMDEARQVLEVVRNWDKAFAELGNELALQPMNDGQFERNVITPLIGLDDPSLDERPRAKQNREDIREDMLMRFRGEHPDGDTRGNSPDTKWCAANVIAEYADWGRRITESTNQINRSFEDGNLKNRGLELVAAA